MTLPNEQSIISPLPSARPLSGRPAIGVPAVSPAVALLLNDESGATSTTTSNSKLRQSLQHINNNTNNSPQQGRLQPPHHETVQFSQRGGIPFAIVPMALAGKIVRSTTLANLPCSSNDDEDDHDDGCPPMEHLSSLVVADPQNASKSPSSPAIVGSVLQPPHQETTSEPCVSIPHVATTTSVRSRPLEEEMKGEQHHQSNVSIKPSSAGMSEERDDDTMAGNDAKAVAAFAAILQRANSTSSSSSVTLPSHTVSTAASRSSPSPFSVEAVRAMILKELIQQEARRDLSSAVQPQPSQTTLHAEDAAGDVAEEGNNHHSNRNSETPYYWCATMLHNMQSQRLVKRCQSLRDLQTDPLASEGSNINHESERSASSVLEAAAVRRDSVEERPTAGIRRRQSVTLLFDDDDDETIAKSTKVMQQPRRYSEEQEQKLQSDNRAPKHHHNRRVLLHTYCCRQHYAAQ